MDSELLCAHPLWACSASRDSPDRVIPRLLQLISIAEASRYSFSPPAGGRAFIVWRAGPDGGALLLLFMLCAEAFNTGSVYLCRRPGMSEEHANSYTVDTGGIKKLVANITGQHYRSATQKHVELLENTLLGVQTKVNWLERHQERVGKTMERLSNRVIKLEEEVRQNNTKNTKLNAEVLQLHNALAGYFKEKEEYLKRQQD